MDENKSKALAAALSQIEKQFGKGSIKKKKKKKKKKKQKKKKQKNKKIKIQKLQLIR